MSPDPKLAEGIARATAHRYGALSRSKESLSCGRALDVAGPREGEDVVDLGCGRGADVARAAGRVGPRGTATGVDDNEQMLAAAAAALDGYPNTRLVLGDLAAVALPDGCADVVVSNCAINHAPDKGAVYREVHRLLRPGGASPSPTWCRTIPSPTPCGTIRPPGPLATAARSRRGTTWPQLRRPACRASRSSGAPSLTRRAAFASAASP